MLKTAASDRPLRISEKPTDGMTQDGNACARLTCRLQRQRSHQADFGFQNSDVTLLIIRNYALHRKQAPVSG